MKKVLSSIIAALAVIVALTGCESAESGSVDVGSDKGSKAEKSEKAKPDNLVGPFKVLGKVEPKAGPIGDYTASVRVKNTGDSPEMAWFTVTVLKGQKILGTLDCIGPNEVGAGRTVTVDCISVDDFKPGWSKVEIQHDGF